MRFLLAFVAFMLSAPAWGQLTVLDSLVDNSAFDRPHDVAWNPDGVHAAVAGKGGTLAIVSVDPNGNISVEDSVSSSALDDAQAVEWSADGASLFVGSSDYFLSYGWDGSSLSFLDSVTDGKMDRINGIHLSGGSAIAASKINYLHVIDIQNPSNLSISSTRNTMPDGAVSPHDVIGWDDYIAIPDQRSDAVGKLYVYKDTGGANQWTLEGAIHSLDMVGANRVEYDSGILYVMNNYSGTVTSFDVTNPRGLKVLDSVVVVGGLGPSGSAPVYDGKWLVVGADEKIVLVDVTDPENLSVLQNLTIPNLSSGGGSAHDLSINGDMVIGTGQSDSLVFTLRIQDP